MILGPRFRRLELVDEEDSYVGSSPLRGEKIWLPLLSLPLCAFWGCILLRANKSPCSQADISGGAGVVFMVKDISGVGV